MTGAGFLVSLSATSLAWIAFLYKLRALWRGRSDPATRALCLSLGLLAVAMTVLTVLYSPVDQALHRPNSAQVIGNGLGVSAGCSGLAFLAHLSLPAARATRLVRVYEFALFVALFVMVACFASMPVLPEDSDFWSHYAAKPFVAEYRMAYLVYLGIVVVNVTILSWRYSAVAAARPSMCFGLRMVALGGLTGMIYVVREAIRVLAPLFGADASAQQLLVARPQVPPAIAVGLLAVGSTMPSWGPRVGVDHAAAWLTAYRSLLRLYPLWSDICSAIPQIALESPAGRVAEASNLRAVHFRLHRRVIEVRDGMVLLRSRVDPLASTHARHLCASRGITGEDAAAVVGALQLLTALTSSTSGSVKDAHPEAFAHLPEMGFSAEVRDLERLARAYGSSLVQGAAKRLGHATFALVE